MPQELVTFFSRVLEKLKHNRLLLRAWLHAFLIYLIRCFELLPAPLLRVKNTNNHNDSE